MSIDFKGNLKKYSEYYKYPFLKNLKFHAQSREGILTAVFSQETQDPAFTEPDTILTCCLTKPALLNCLNCSNLPTELWLFFA